MFTCAAIAIGLNIGTYHFDRSAGFQEFNPGGYAVCDGWVAGAYYNSYKRTSVHAGYVFQLGPVDVEVGLVSGYPASKLLPAVVPSVRIGNARIALIPPSGEKRKGGLTLALEY